MSKAFVYVDSGDTAAHDAAAAGVGSVLAEYGVRMLVEASDAQLQALTNAGIEVQPAADLDVIMLPSVVIDTREGDPPSAPVGWEIAAAANAAVYWIVQFVGPPLPEWVEAVQNEGAQIVSALGETTVLAKMTSGKANTVRALPHVQWVGRHEPLYTIEPTLANESAPVPVAQQDRLTKAAGGNGIPAEEQVELTVALFDESKQADVIAAIQTAGGAITVSDGDTIVCKVARSAIPALAALPAVGHISR